MQADHIMTKDVVTVRPETPITEIAELMTKHRISGVPVVDAGGDLIGIVSETDLLHRAETGTEKRRKWWIALFVDADMRARDFIKMHGRTAEDVMTRYVISIPHDAPLAQVADILEANNLKRAPVLRGGRLAGIVTRGDLVRAFVDTKAMQQPAYKEPGALQKAIAERLSRQSWVNSSYINTVVTDSTVELRGLVDSQDQANALRLLVAELAGEREVVSHLTVGARARLPAV